MNAIYKLRKVASDLGCTVEDDKENANLYVYAPDGKGWDEGTLTALVHPYGMGGSITREWRLDAITTATHRLKEMGAPIHDTDKS